MIFSLILAIVLTNNAYAIEFSPLVATNANGTKIHQGFIGEPIIFQHTTSNDDVVPLDFELVFTTGLPDDTIVAKKTIPVHLNPNETKTVTYQFVPTKEGNFITGVFTELYILGDSVTFSVLDASKNYKTETVMIHANPSEKNCSRVCTNPSEMTVNVGTVVEWLNESPNSQTIQTGIYKEDAKGISFSADGRLVGKIEPESKFPFLFMEPGDYKYYFSDHGFLQYAGIIHVMPNDQPYNFDMVSSNDNASKIIHGGSFSPNKTVFPVPWENRSPLKQFKDGIDPSVIHCSDKLVLIQKYDGTPACVKPETKTKLIERGWGTMLYLDKTMEVQGTNHSVKYRIDGNATVTNSIYSKNTASVIITLDTITSGNLTIELPRTIIDSGHSNCDPHYEKEEPFAVLIDHEEVAFDEIATTSEKRTLSISFQENTREIEIIAFCLI